MIDIDGWHMLAFFLGSGLTIFALGFRVRDYDYDEDDGYGFDDFDDEETKEYFRGDR